MTHSEYLKNDFLVKGRFLTVLPSFMLKVPGWHPRLRALPVALPNTRAPIGLITLKGRTLTQLAQLFIDNIRHISKPMGEIPLGEIRPKPRRRLLALTSNCCTAQNSVAIRRQRT